MGFTAQSTFKCYYSSNFLTNQFGVVACELHLMQYSSGSIPMYSIFVFFGPVFLGGPGRPPGFLAAAILEACLGSGQARLHAGRPGLAAYEHCFGITLQWRCREIVVWMKQ
jgi:hypothetical protein